MTDETIAALGDAMSMFVYLGMELTALFLVISFIVGVIQEYLPASKIQDILSSKGGKGYFSAAMLGSVTPFCSCSTIPMLTGLLKAKAGFGPTLTFLFTSPLLNPIIIGLFFVTFGAEITLSYAIIALVISISAAVLLEKLGFDRYIRSEMFSSKGGGGCGNTIAMERAGSCRNAEQDAEKMAGGPPCESISVDCSGSAVAQIDNSVDWKSIWQQTWQQFTQVLPYLLIGIAVGSITYGFMPAEFLTEYAGADNPLAVPVAAIIGVPLYIRAEAAIPLAAALIAKGMSMGTIMALIIGSAGASITEVVLLRSMFTRPMIIAFLLVIFGMAIFAGFFFNSFF